MTVPYNRPPYPSRRFPSGESGTIRKDWGGRLPIALIFPNRYRVAMSNLGFQTLYGLFNAEPEIVCERAVWEGPGWPVLSLESQRHLAEFPLWAVSIPFELDYLHLVPLIQQAGIPLWAADREDGDPLLLGGGVALSANPEPVAPFFDAVVIGEAEPVLEELLAVLRAARGQVRREILAALAAVEGVYVPLLHDGRPIVRRWARDLSTFATTSVVLTRQTEFGDVYLIEIARGCCWHCRFCLAGQITAPPRFRRLEQLRPQIEEGLRHRRRIGLIGAAVTDHPDLEAIIEEIRAAGGGVTVSSLRADQLSPQVLAGLQAGGLKTLTLAPEVGSARLAEAIGKGFGEETLLQGLDMADQAGLRYFKLYFMLGLPGETDTDVAAIVALVQRIRERFPRASLSLSVAPFVPKAHTPFQWAPLAPAAVLEGRLRHLKRELQSLRVSVQGESVAWSRVQGVLARGDYRLAEVLARISSRSIGNWRRAMKYFRLDEKEYLRERGLEEPLPWDHIESGVDKERIWREWERAQAGLGINEGKPLHLVERLS